VEIWEYFKNIAVEYDLLKYVKLRHEIIGAFWNEEEGLWHVQVRRIETGEEFEDTAEILINGGGILKYDSYAP
jgi:cation diffusion facilitator CzcD-associated flavoprotein CzcO